MKYILGALLILLCILNSSLLYGSVLRYPGRKSRIIAALLISVLTASGGLSRLADDETAEIIIDVLLPAASCVLPYAMFKPGSKKTFFLSGIMLCSVFDLLEYAAAAIFDGTSLDITLTIYISLYVFACASAYAAGRLLKSRNIPYFLEQIPPIVYLSVFIINYSAYYGLSVLKESESYAGAAVALNYISACLAACGISFIIYRYAVLAKKQKDDEKLFALELSRYEEILRNNHEMSAFRHDYKNNLFALKTLIETNRTSEAREYISSLTGSLDLTRSRFQTGNLLADAIISDKAAKAEKYEIRMEFEGALPADGISGRDLCVILSNSLDNAVDACADIPSAVIRIKSELKENGVRITVTNPVLKKVEIHNGRIQTSKADKSAHGFGISNIRNTVKKYNGYADISCSDEEFVLEIGVVFEKK